MPHARKTARATSRAAALPVTTGLAARLRTLIDTFDDGVVARAAQRIGLGQPGLHDLLHGVTKDPTVSTALRIARAYAVSLDFLLSGETSRVRDVEEDELDVAFWQGYRVAALEMKTHTTDLLAKTRHPVGAKAALMVTDLPVDYVPPTRRPVEGQSSTAETKSRRRRRA